MKNLILAHFKLYEFNAEQIRINIQAKEYRLIGIGLKNYRNKVRREILHQLKNVIVKENYLHKILLAIVEKGFMKNAALAIDILNKSSTFEEKELANRIYFERLRRKENKTQFHKTFRRKITKDQVLDKSKMKQLERVRQQLKKPINLRL